MVKAQRPVVNDQTLRVSRMGRFVPAPVQTRKGRALGSPKQAPPGPSEPSKPTGATSCDDFESAVSVPGAPQTSNIGPQFSQAQALPLIDRQ